MAAIVELLPATRITSESFVQDADSIVDVSGYTEAAVMFSVMEMTVTGGDSVLILQTSIDNREDQFAEFVSKVFSSTPAEFPYVHYIYLHGSSNGSSDAPGFARYLRFAFAQGSGASAVIAVKAVFKP